MRECVIRDFSAGYGKDKVLDGIRMRCKSGEITALMGENGSGKTTLFNGLMSVDAKAEGNCMLDGTDLLKLPAKKRACMAALLPQSVEIPHGYRCLDVLLSGFYPHLGLFGQPGRQMKKDAETIAAELGILDLLERDFPAISEGQKQMVLLARTLVQDTPLILMDEPDNALDFTNKYKMMEFFLEIVEKKDKIGLVILHDPALVLAYCRHIYLLGGGKILTEIYPGEEKRERIEQKFRLLYPHFKLLETEDGLVPVYGRENRHHYVKKDIY